MGSATGIQWVEARDAAKHPSVMHRAAPTTRNALAQNVRSDEVEKPCSRLLEVSLSSLDWPVGLPNAIPIRSKHKGLFRDVFSSAASWLFF